MSDEVEYYFTSVSHDPDSHFGVYGYATMDFDKDSDSTSPIESSISYKFFNLKSTNVAELEVRAIHEAVKQGIAKSLDFAIVTHHYCSVQALNKLSKNLIKTLSKYKESYLHDTLKHIYVDIAILISNVARFKGFITVKSKNVDDATQIKFIQSHNKYIGNLKALQMSEGNKIVSNAMYKHLLNVMNIDSVNTMNSQGVNIVNNSSTVNVLNYNDYLLLDNIVIEDNSDWLNAYT